MTRRSRWPTRAGNSALLAWAGRRVWSITALCSVAASVTFLLGDAIAAAGAPAAAGRLVYTSVGYAATGADGPLEAQLRVANAAGGDDQILPLDFTALAPASCSFYRTEPAVDPVRKRLAFVASDDCLGPGESSDVGIYTGPLSGGRVTLVKGPLAYPSGSPAFSPSGKRLAYATATGHHGTQLLLAATNGHHTTSLTHHSEGRFDEGPTWGPGGRRIYFVRARRFDMEDTGLTQALGEIAWISPHGGRIHTLVRGAGNGWPRVSPDGRWVVFNRYSRNGASLYRVRASGGRPQRLTRGSHYDVTPDWAPSGRAIAFARGTRGRHRIAILSLATPRVRLVPGLASARNAEQPIWIAPRD